jgi:hypothetical protein
VREIFQPGVESEIGVGNVADIPDGAMDVEYEAEYYDDGDNENERSEYRNTKLERIPLPEWATERYAFLSELPRSVGVMGGVARSVAREILTGDREPIRDIDFVSIDDPDGEDADDAALDMLAQKNMSDDYRQGYGISRDSLDNYFATRDFTINQVLILNGELIIGETARNDFIENIIRPTYYEMPRWDWNLKSKLAIKALLMRVVFERITSSVPLLEDCQIEPEYIRDFDIALGVNKAMSRGARTAVYFTEDLVDWGLLPTDLAGKPVAAARHLHQLTDFEFRPNGETEYRGDNHNDRQPERLVDRTMSALEQHHSSDPAIRGAIAEYDDDNKLEFDDEEITDGFYTEGDYSYINW